MAIIPLSQLPGGKAAGKSGSNIIPIDQLPKSSVDMSNMYGDDAAAETPEASKKLGGAGAVGVEMLRGAGEGSGQLIADAGMIGSLVPGLGDAGRGVQKYGQDIAAKASGMPETDLPGIVKGGANLVGQAAPMLATFGAGEAAGVARAGEVAAEGIATLWNTPRLAAATKVFTRAMGQATLFGTVNAIDTAAMMPEHTEFKSRVDQIMQSGKTGFITGALLTPLLDHGVEVFKKLGEKALKTYMVGLTGSEKAAESAMDLTRTPGTYEMVAKVDPSKPLGQRIELKNVAAKDLATSDVQATHEAMVRDQEIAIQDTKNAHDTMRTQLEDKIAEQNLQASQDEATLRTQMEAEFGDVKLGKNIKLDASYDQKVGLLKDAAQQAKVKASQNLQMSQKAFEANLASSLTLINDAKDAAYESVVKNAPGAGFSAKGIIGKVKEMMQRDYGLTLTKEGAIPGGLDPSKLSPSALAQLEGQVEKKWVVKSRSLSGQVSPEILKMTKYLTETFLPNIEEKIASNNGVVHLDMLRQEMKNIDGLAWEDGQRKNPGFSKLYTTVRPNQLIGDITKNEPGMFVGSKAALKEMKKAAVLDQQFVRVKNLADEYSKVAGKIESSAGSYGKDLGTMGTLAELEAAVELSPRSNLRLTNSMKKYYDMTTNITAKQEASISKVAEGLKLQKKAVSDEISKMQSDAVSSRMSDKYDKNNQYKTERRQALDAKRAEIGQHQQTLYDLQQSLTQEKFDRAAALNETRTIGRGDTPIGRVQRGFVTGAGYGALFGNPKALVMGPVSGLLSPKLGIGVARGIKKFAESSAGKALNAAALASTQSSAAQKLLIGSLLRQSRQKK